VARRKYRSEAISTAGHGERPANPTPDESFQRPIEPLSEQSPQQTTSYPQAASEPAQSVTGLGEQMRQQQQHAQLAQLHAFINSIPNLSLPQRQWLAAHPHALHRFDLLHAAHQMAQAHGIAPDSDDYFRVLESALHHYGHLPPQQMAQPAPAPAMPAPPPMPPVTHVDAEKVESPAGEPESEQMAVHHVSAPVSRGAEHYSADYEPGSDSRVTLSTAEREHARASGVSDEVYAREKMRMMKMKKSKLIKDE
jgi:hypothetical protein